MKWYHYPNKQCNWLNSLKFSLSYEVKILQKPKLQFQSFAHFIFVWCANLFQFSEKASWKDEVKKHMGISTSESNKLQTYLYSVGFNLLDEVLGIGGGGVVLLGKEQSG